MNEQLKHKKATYHLYTFLVSKMIGSLGSHVYAFGISMYILSLTGSSLSFATNILLSYLPRIIFSPIAGLIGDRIPRKWLVLGGQAGVILSISTLLFYTHTVELSLIAIYITTVFNSIFSSFSSVAFSASIANLVDEARLQKAMSFNQLAQSISGIGGPVFGGMLFGFVSMEIFLAAFIVAAVITLSLESTMNFTLYKKAAITNDGQKETMFQSLKAGFRYVSKQHVLRSILWTALWLNLFFTSINIGGDFILVTILKLDPTLIGFTEAGAAIGMLITSIYFATRSNVKFPLVFVKRTLLLMSSLILIAAIPLFFHFSTILNFTFYFILMLLFGSLGVLTNTPLGVMLQLSVEEEYRGRVFGIVEMMSMSMMPVGTLLYGFLYDILPAEWILIVSGMILIICVLLLLRTSIIEMAHPELKKEQQKEILQA
ncbi:MFS transporter [Lysinibacillus sp. 2017]|uniref:MFS transporter n=1 Tax=unclassified Lysinibacillus TaxID=2636778 RepID=UPI000D529516|nr:MULTISPECIES: MFS transporter [unclassified Lysinibacillus]AWE07115.1 MFS transporter [Lysinibacillus sp. 2017]TGN36966.1 MFS transporter [Lysinibacillus sp. S2017]